MSQSDDIAEVVLAELYCTKKLEILPGPKKKRRYWRTGLFGESVADEFHWTSNVTLQRMFVFLKLNLKPVS